MITHIARLGKVIGQYSAVDLVKALTDGTVKEGDHWWRPGMEGWKLVSLESPLISEPPKPAKPSSQEEEDWRIRPKHKPSQFGDEPATEKQLALIKDAGLTDTVGLTKYDASRWLDLILGTDDGRKSLNARQFQAMQEKQEQNQKAGLGCGGHRTPSGKYREEIEFALKCLEEKKEEAHQSIEDDPDDKAYYLSSLKDDERKCRQEVNEQMAWRAEYWIWVIKCSKAKTADKRWEMMSGDESWETYMYVEDALADRLFSIASRLARVPTKKEIKDLLAKLDAGSDDWDDTQPDLLLAELLKVIV